MKSFLLCLLASIITTLAVTSCSCCPGVPADPTETHGPQTTTQTPPKKAGGY
jgi:hypothetical protein